MLIRVAACIALGLLAQPAEAELRTPHLFSDHAVLQRDRPIHIWGWATPGASVEVVLHGQHGHSIANRLGGWDAWLMPEAAGGPYSLTISGDGGSTTIHDVMIGDVWFASGQSNMEMPLAGFPPTAHVKNSAAEIAAATDPHVRLLRVEHKLSTMPLRDVDQSWTETTPQTAAPFSAIGYFFARAAFKRLREKMDPRRANGGVFLGLNGIVIKSHGGTDAEGFATAIEIGYSMVRNELIPKINRDLAFHTVAREEAGEKIAQAGGM